MMIARLSWDTIKSWYNKEVELFFFIVHKMFTSSVFIYKHCLTKIESQVYSVCALYSSTVW